MAIRRWFTAAISWLFDQAIEHWPSIAILVGGSIMGVLAAISNWLAPYGPIAWGSVGIASILVLVFIYWLYGLARAKIATADYAKAKSMASIVNVLSPTHNHEKINLVDFFNHFYMSNDDIRFEGCDSVGPALILLDECQLLSSRFIDCEVVIGRTDRLVRGAAKFRHCTILRCRIFRVTFIMDYEAYIALPDIFNKTDPD